jgi:hypothetical protein
MSDKSFSSKASRGSGVNPSLPEAKARNASGPWQQAEIERARSVPLLAVLAHVAAYVKEDLEYTPRNTSRDSRRFHVSCNDCEFRLILTGEKWFDELVGGTSSRRGGGGAIDLVMHLTGMNFVRAVKACLDAAGPN